MPACSPRPARVPGFLNFPNLKELTVFSRTTPWRPLSRPVPTSNVDRVIALIELTGGVDQAAPTTHFAEQRMRCLLHKTQFWRVTPSPALSIQPRLLRQPLSRADLNDQNTRTGLETGQRRHATKRLQNFPDAAQVVSPYPAPPPSSQAPGSPVSELQRGAKAEGKIKGRGTGVRERACLHGGKAAHARPAGVPPPGRKPHQRWATAVSGPPGLLRVRWSFGQKTSSAAVDLPADRGNRQGRPHPMFINGRR